MLPFIRIRQAHLIQYRLEPVFDLLATGTMVFGFGGLVQLVAYFMVGGSCIFGKSGSTPPLPTVKIG